MRNSSTINHEGQSENLLGMVLNSEEKAYKLYNKYVMQTRFSIRGINNVPYRMVRLVYTLPASKPVRLTPLFRTRKNIGRTGHVLAVPVNFGQYRPIPGVPPVQKKSFLLLLLLFFFFLSLVIFEFLLGQNGNLFALIY